jgi:CRISPR/Cas system Type II protein with McrA/HNH and RuvC-like nuclease domain
MQWQNDLVNFNKAHLKNDRLSEFLWGTSRTNVAVLAQDLTELQAGYCFYCETKLNTKKIHVDHVLPWSRFLINGVSNLVATDDKCNLNKSDNLPVHKHIQNALDRNLGDLNAIANKRNFAVMRDSTQLIATNIYKITPAGTPLWVGRGKDPQPHTIPA